MSSVQQRKALLLSLTILIWISEVYATTLRSSTTKAASSRGGGSKADDDDDDDVPIPKTKAGVIAGIVLGSRTSFRI